MRPVYQYAAKLVRAIDGDTYVLDIDLGFHVWQRASIRLLDWNCPELNEPTGVGARDTANLLLTGATQIVVRTKKDAQSFARWLADVEVDGHDLGELLSTAGFATKAGTIKGGTV